MRIKTIPVAKSSLERGFALITVLLLLIVLSSVAVALMYTVNTEAHMQGNDSANTVAYYGAEAGMEKMMADLSALYQGATAPTATAIQNVACPGGGSCVNSPDPASLNGTTFSQYSIGLPPGGAVYQNRAISAGPNAGLQAQILPLTLTVIADRPGGEEVQLTRQVEIALIPVFQFGVFCGGDCDYFAGPTFNFGGRVHSNQNIFMAEGAGSDLIFDRPVHAVGDIVRDTLSNGVALSGDPGNHTGNVWAPTAPGGCNGFNGGGAAPANCRALGWNNPDEGSSTGGTVTPNSPVYPTCCGAPNPNWGTISKTTYNGMLLTGATGVKPLNLPFVNGAQNNTNGNAQIEIIRRPKPTTDTAVLADSRLYNKAAIRILLDDDPANLPGGAADPENMPLGNVGPFANGVAIPIPGSGQNTYWAEENTGVDPNWSGTGWILPNTFGQPMYTWNGTQYTLTGGAPTNALIGGFLRVEVLTPGGAYVPVTDKWLSLGWARQYNQTPDSEHGISNTVNPNAILDFQQQSTPTLYAANDVANPKNVWWPINIFDPREGYYRDLAPSPGACTVSGVLNLVDIDVGNLTKWINSYGTINSTFQNGYVVYFSDRRGELVNPHLAIDEGDYGFTDVINEANSDGSPNGFADPGEMLDDPIQGTTAPQLETYGQWNLGYGFNPAPPTPVTPPNAVVPAGKIGSSCGNAEQNWVSGARHGVRLINASLGNLPTRPNNDPTNNAGFTLASENPAYVMGNYNANDAGYGDPHGSSAVIADTVTLLSKNWADSNSFASPDAPSGRPAQPTYFRLAIATGKNQDFKQSSVANLPNGAAPAPDFGTDGGMHNFLRLMESWGGGIQLHYRGSMVSLYYSMYATGVYKCCNTVYGAPRRLFEFDDDFTDITKMPPGTPRFEDVVNVGFRQNFNAR